MASTGCFPAYDGCRVRYFPLGDALRPALLEELEKAETFIVVYTDYKLSTGAPEDAGACFTAPDRILWNDRVWRVVRVRDWHMFGYCQALAVLIE